MRYGIGRAHGFSRRTIPDEIDSGCVRASKGGYEMGRGSNDVGLYGEENDDLGALADAQAGWNPNVVHERAEWRDDSGLTEVERKGARNREADRDFELAAEIAAQKAETRQHVTDRFSAYDKLAKESGTTLADAMDRYVNIDRQFHSNPAEAFLTIARNTGFTPAQVVQMLAPFAGHVDGGAAIAHHHLHQTSADQAVAAVAESLGDGWAPIEGAVIKALSDGSIRKTGDYAADLKAAVHHVVRAQQKAKEAASVENAKRASASVGGPNANSRRHEDDDKPKRPKKLTMDERFSKTVEEVAGGSRGRKNHREEIEADVERAVRLLAGA
jgi:hypothetical protein